jgi:phosphonopyruvate decarboxylase
MLDTNEFFNKLVEQKYTHFCVVPCSFAKNIINAAVNNYQLIEYVPCASEAVACSVAAGLKMSGQNPIVIVQSSGLTNMASCVTSLLVPYQINFPIITSWRTYKDGDSEIQHQHLASKLPDLINAYGYDYEILDQENLDHAISQINRSNIQKTICILKKETFTKVELEPKHRLDLSSKIPRSKYLEALNENFGFSEDLFIGTTGNTAREMYSFMPDTNNFYMAGNMGGALSLGLGASKGGKRVWVCGGDAEFVMHLGGLTTAGRYKRKIDLSYILFDNESNKSTGGQNTQQNHVDYLGIAKSSGLTTVGGVIDSVRAFHEALQQSEASDGVKFMHVKCGYDKETPRPPKDIVKTNTFC